MKKLLLLVIILGAGYLVYNKFYNYNPVEIKDNIVLSQQTALDINSASVTPAPRFAFIEGEIRNRGEKDLTNVLIIYTIGYDTLSAYINLLESGNSRSFETNRCMVRVKSPKYYLVEIKYE